MLVSSRIRETEHESFLSEVRVNFGWANQTDEVELFCGWQTALTRGDFGIGVLKPV
jgi:hypothetical protein